MAGSAGNDVSARVTMAKVKGGPAPAVTAGAAGSLPIMDILVAGVGVAPTGVELMKLT